MPETSKDNTPTGILGRGEELSTEKFPELHFLASVLPDGTVLDGEIVATLPDQILPFSDLQKRLGRKKPSAKMIAQIPCAFKPYDILESEGEDCREKQLFERKKTLDELCNQFGVNEPFHSSQ